VQMRKDLELTVNLVHGFTLPGIPVRHEDLDIVVIRCALCCYSVVSHASHASHVSFMVVMCNGSCTSMAVPLSGQTTTQRGHHVSMCSRCSCKGRCCDCAQTLDRAAAQPTTRVTTTHSCVCSCCCCCCCCCFRENLEGEYSGLEHEVVDGVVESLKVRGCLRM
jgi:isocitrate/isopropylmalate dehydrogenase